MSAVRALHAVRMRRLSREQEPHYAVPSSEEEVAAWQFERLNERWADITGNVEHFRLLKKERGLPDRFASWAEFQASIPFMDRKTVQEKSNRLLNTSRRPGYWGATGGSTFEPIRVPFWNSEARVAASDVWLGRSWLGVSPEDRLFLIWGHSHMLGRGLHGLRTRLVRNVKDVALGYLRWSAYDVSEDRLREAGKRLLEFRPRYVLGYSTALDRFARVNRELRPAFQELRLKVAIATGEGFPSADSRELIEDVLGCPVSMEYGSVETGPIAYEARRSGFLVFWRHHHLEYVPSERGPGEVAVTSLYPRCLPLVRYRLGDLVSLIGTRTSVRLGFSAVVGRCNDTVALPDGAVIHSEAFTHVVRDCLEILDYQVLQLGDCNLRLQYRAANDISQAREAEIRARLAKIHELLGGMGIERVPEIPTTVAGKTPRVRRVGATPEPGVSRCS